MVYLWPVHFSICIVLNFSVATHHIHHCGGGLIDFDDVSAAVDWF